MAIRTVVTRGYGNGTFDGSIGLVVTRGYLGIEAPPVAEPPVIVLDPGDTPFIQARPVIPFPITVKTDGPATAFFSATARYTIATLVLAMALATLEVRAVSSLMIHQRALASYVARITVDPVTWHLKARHELEKELTALKKRHKRETIQRWLGLIE